ncbi:MAG TPA: DinB family protein, partial [Gemmatimonadales bacterium]|nr:DinB family protein [Gemmatimonadales bacterium]
NSYVPAGRFDARAVADLAAELDAVRRATIALLRGFDAAALARRGTATGPDVSVRALAYIIAGHERHHLAILRERYLT